MKKVTPSPDASAKSTGSSTGSQWGSGAPQTSGVGSGSIDMGGSITIPGAGTATTSTAWQQGEHAGATRTVSTPSDLVLSAASGTPISASYLKNLFLKLDKANSPFLKQFMGMYGVTDKKVAQAIWNSAADYAAKLAGTGEKIDFVNDVLRNQNFLTNYLTLPKGVSTGGTGTTVQSYVTNYFDKSGKPNAAATQLLSDTLAKTLNRTPTAAEIAEYQPLLADMYKQQKAGLFTTTQNSKTGVTTPGVNVADWLTQQVVNKHQARIEYGKETAQQSNTDKYVQLATAYGVNPYAADGKTLSANSMLQLSKVEANKLTLDDVQEQFKQAALARYAYLKPQFDAGLTLQQVADPAISAVASILERDQNSISVNDPLVQKYLSGLDGKGVMPMYAYESLLKKDPSWQFTKNAHAQFADIAAAIGSRFGMNV